LAVANYHSAYGSLPPAYVADKDGRPMHSWRVLILPVLEQSQLYNAYNFAEPWNGPNNRALAGKIGGIYLRSGLEPVENHTTSFVAVVGPRTAWPGATPTTFQDLADGERDTLMVVEVPDGRFLWMEPKDLKFDQMSFRINDSRAHGLGSKLGGARVVNSGGSVSTLHENVDPDTLKLMLAVKGVKKLNPASGEDRSEDN
jgi:hypothetical protein